MLLRALLVLLAVLNLGVALWWALHPAPPDTPVAVALPAGVPGLRLLSDAGRPVAPVPRCYRFGPYADADALAAARDAATSLATPIEVVTVPGTPPAAWRVAAPPPRDGDTAALATRIVAAGLDDYHVVAEGPEAGSISLGRFGTRDAAVRRQLAIRDAGFDALVLPVGGTSDWLQLAIPPGTRVATARAALGALQAAPVPCADGR